MAILEDVLTARMQKESSMNMPAQRSSDEARISSEIDAALDAAVQKAQSFKIPLTQEDALRRELSRKANIEKTQRIAQAENDLLTEKTARQSMGAQGGVDMYKNQMQGMFQAMTQNMQAKIFNNQAKYSRMIDGYVDEKGVHHKGIRQMEQDYENKFRSGEKKLDRETLTRINDMKIEAQKLRAESELKVGKLKGLGQIVGTLISSPAFKGAPILDADGNQQVIGGVPQFEKKTPGQWIKQLGLIGGVTMLTLSDDPDFEISKGLRALKTWVPDINIGAAIEDGVRTLGTWFPQINLGKSIEALKTWDLAPQLEKAGQWIDDRGFSIKPLDNLKRYAESRGMKMSDVTTPINEGFEAVKTWPGAAWGGASNLLNWTKNKVTTPLVDSLPPGAGEAMLGYWAYDKMSSGMGDYLWQGSASKPLGGARSLFYNDISGKFEPFWKSYPKHKLFNEAYDNRFTGFKDDEA